MKRWIKLKHFCITNNFGWIISKIFVYKPWGGTLGFLSGNDVFTSGGLFGSGTKIGFCKGNDIFSVGSLFGSSKLGYVSGTYVYSISGSIFGGNRVGYIVGKDVYDTNKKHVARMDEANLKLGAATLLLLK